MKINCICLYKLKNIALGLVFLLLPSLIFCPKFAQASAFFHLSASGISIENKSVNVELYLTIARMDEVEKILKSGASIEISCNTNLLRKNPIFYDTSIEYQDITWFLRYDALTREFLLSYNDSLVQRNRDLKKLVDSIFFPLSLDLAHADLEARTAYTIDVELNLRQAKIPAWIEKTLFFWDWNLISTRYSFDFTLPEDYDISYNQGADYV